MGITPSKIEIDFTDERISASAGSVFPSWLAGRMARGEQLKKTIKGKKRSRRASDVEMLLSLPCSLAQGDGAIFDKEVMEACRSRGSDYSVSLTSETYTRPLRR